MFVTKPLPLPKEYQQKLSKYLKNSRVNKTLLEIYFESNH